MGKLDDFATDARANGYTWDEIKGQVQGFRGSAAGAGYSDDEVNKFLGLGNPDAPTPALKSQAQGLIDALPKPEGSNPVMSYLDAFRQSSGGLLIFGKTKVDTPPPDGEFAHIASMLGGTVGDLPAMAVGAIAGTAAGAAMTVNPVGAAIGGAMGGFGLPASIKANYADGVKNGNYTSAWDYASRQAVVWHETAKAAATGAAMVAGGAVAAPLGVLGTLGGEVVATTVAAKALEGQLPAPEDFLDNAIMIGAFKGVEAATKYAPMVRDNLLDYWKRTDEKPADSAALAGMDEKFRQDMTQPPTPAIPEGASVTKDADGSGSLVIERPPVPPEPEVAPVEKPTPPPEASGKESTFDPTADYTDPKTARAAVASRIAPPDSAAPLAERIAEVFHNLRKEQIDHSAPIHDLEEAVAAGKPLDAASSPKIIAEVSRVSGERSRIMVEKGMMDFQGDQSGPGLLPILDEADKIAGNNQDFWTHAVARWAVEKAAQGKETGVNIDAARTVIADDAGRFDDVFQKLQDWQNGTLSYLQDAGVISQETYDALVAENAARIPGYREGKEGSGGAAGGIKPIKEFKGSDLRVKDILTSLIHDAFVRVELANRLRYSTAVNDLGVQVGVAVEGPSTRPIKFEFSLDEMEKFGAEHVAEGDSAIWRQIGRDLAPDEAFSVKDGKATIVKWDDPEIPEILKGYDLPTLDTFGRIMAAVTRVQKDLITLDPTFPIRMKVYDLPQQFITNPGFTFTLGQFIEGFGHTLVGSEKYQDAVNRGVVSNVVERVTNTAYARNVWAGRQDPAFTTGIRNAIQSAAKAPMRVLHFWAKLWQQSSEVGNMIARDRKNPGDPLRNAAEATQAAFPQPGRSGSSARLLNALNPFHTAYMNGLETTARGQLGIGSTVGGKPFNAATFTLKALAIVTAPVLASYFLNRDKDWYKETPDWQKDNGLLFPPVEAGGSPIFLKYPPIISFLYGALPRRIAEKLSTGNDTDAGSLAKSFAWSFAPPGGLLTYSLGTPIIEKIANHSFHTGAPLNPSALSGPKGPQAQEQFVPYSTETAKNLSVGMNNRPLLRGLNMTPPEIDNFIHGWGGSIAPAIVGYAEKALGLHPQAPLAHWEDLPGASSFFARNTGFSAQSVKDFVGTMDNAASVHASLGIAMGSGDIKRFEDLVNENPVAAVMSAPSFGVSVRGLEAAGNAVAEPRYVEALTAAVKRLGSDGTEAVGALMLTDKTVSFLRTYTGLVEGVESPTTRSAVEALSNEFVGEGTGVKGPFSATDKRQLLDRAYGWLLTTTRYGKDQAEGLGMK